MEENSKNFQQYAAIYDLIYSEKDTKAEIEYVLGLINKFAPKANTLLDLGCGTGRHSVPLGASGLSVVGVDQSEGMLSKARNRAEQNGLGQKVRFHASDIRNLNLGEKFDVVSCLFHVFSYLPTRADCLTFLKIVKTHLKPNGVFLFDFWHAGAVLNEPPQTRVKRIKTETLDITRIGEPSLDVTNSWVNLRYEFFIRNLSTGHVDTFAETHRMHYFTLAEVSDLLDEVGMKPLSQEEWLTGNPIQLKTFGALFLAH